MSIYVSDITLDATTLLVALNCTLGSRSFNSTMFEPEMCWLMQYLYHLEYVQGIAKAIVSQFDDSSVVLEAGMLFTLRFIVSPGAQS